MNKMKITLRRCKNSVWKVIVEKDGKVYTYSLQDFDTSPYKETINFMIRMAESSNAGKVVFTAK